jgi:hypothetical protein
MIERNSSDCKSVDILTHRIGSMGVPSRRLMMMMIIIIIMSRFSDVTIDGLWVGDWLY